MNVEITRSYVVLVIVPTGSLVDSIITKINDRILRYTHTPLGVDFPYIL